LKFKVDFIAPIGKVMYVVNTGDWRVLRPVTNKDKCRKCGACSVLCPTNSIEEKIDCFEANLDFCKGCGQCASVCWAKAITMEAEMRE
jgi:pyruvate ferredoxin oxidoreductase delta subunit